MSTSTYFHKRGDTLSLGGFAAAGVLPSGATGRSQLRNPLAGNALVATLKVTLGDYVDDLTPRSLLLEAKDLDSDAWLDTNSWPIVALDGDIEFSEPGGVVISTSTFVIKVVVDITRPA